MKLKFLPPILLGLLCLPFYHLSAQKPDYTPPDLYQNNDEGIFREEGVYDKNGKKTGVWTAFLEASTEIYDLDHTGKTPIKAEGQYLIRFKGNYVDGKKEGLFEAFVIEKASPTNFFKIYEQTYKADELTGEWITFDLKGNVVGKIKVSEEGKPQEEYSYLMGKLRQKRIFEKDLANYIQYEYYLPSEKLSQEISYRNNQLHGPFLEYHENGKLKVSGFHKNGIGDSTWTYYFSSGITKGVSNVKMGKLHGLNQTYYPDGTLQSSSYYKNDTIHGTYTYYHANGQVWQQVEYVDGKYGEVMASFDREGNAKQKGSLKDGKGTIYYYHEDGRLREIIKYENGVKVAGKKAE